MSSVDPMSDAAGPGVAGRGGAEDDADAVDEVFFGAGKGAERWKLELTPRHLRAGLEGAEPRLVLSREEVADELGIGALGRAQVTLLLRRPPPQVLTFPRSALTSIHTWLGSALQRRLERRLLRSGWGSTFIAGLLVGATTHHLGASVALGWLAGGLLMTAALVGRFAANPLSFVLRGLGLFGFGALLVYGVVYRGDNPWLVAVCVPLSWAIIRYARLFSFCAAGK